MINIFFLSFYNSDQDLNKTLYRKFQGVWLQAKKNLHDSTFVTPDQGRMLAINMEVSFIGFMTISDVFEHDWQTQPLGTGL